MGDDSPSSPENGGGWTAIFSGWFRSKDGSRHVAPPAGSPAWEKAAQSPSHASNEATTNMFQGINDLKHPVNANDDQAAAERENEKYKQDCVGRIARNKFFECTTIGVIMMNAIVIGYDTDYNARWGKDANLYKGPVFFILSENVFATYFSLEILIRFFAYKRKLSCLCDAWFVFDTCLVTCMVAETWILPFLGSGNPLGNVSMFRLLRLMRISRMGKLMRYAPELMMIVRGIAAAVKAVAWTAVLLVIITYTWAILFTNEYHQGRMTNEEVAEEGGIEDLFGSMGKSMLSLLVMGTILDDVTACTDAIRESGNRTMLFAFLLYILINSFTMMNMLVGILVEVVGNTAEGEKERVTEDRVRTTITDMFAKLDRDDSGMVTKEEFQNMKQDKNVKNALKELHIKGKQFEQYAYLLFDEDENTEIDFETLLGMIFRLRPGAPVGALDFADFKQKLLDRQTQLGSQVSRIGRLVERFATCTADQVSTAPADSSVGTAGLIPKPAESDPRAVSSASNASMPAPAAAKISLEMLAQLDQTPSEQIIVELQRRLGIEVGVEAGVPLCLMDEELQRRMASGTEALLLGTQPSAVVWSQETHTC